MNRLKLALFNSLISSLVLASSCAKKLQDEDATVGANDAEIESAVTAVSSLLDEGAGVDYSAHYKLHSPFELLLPKAYASSCQRAALSNCVNQTRSASYESCQFGQIQMSGSVNLAYSQPGCSMLTDGSSVTRNYNITRVGPRGGTLVTSSDPKQDYRLSEPAYGGGGRLTKTSSGHTVEILGKHKSLTIRNREVYSVSMRTVAGQPLLVTGGLGRADRTIISGQLEVNHNKAERTAVWTFNNLQYATGCAHPVSGSIDITWTGSKTGTAQLTFAGCGTASLNESGQSSQVELSYSE